MIPANDKINRRQFIAICFICTLAPVVHHIPVSPARYAGYGAWLSVLLSAVPATTLFFIHSALLRSKGDGRGLCEIYRDALGQAAGNTYIVLYTIWFLFLAGFVLRSGAERFVSTIYPNSGPLIFMVVTLLACVPAAMGELKSIARTAMLFRPWLILALALIFIFTLPEVDLTGFWQVGTKNELAVLKGIPAAIEPLCFVTCIAFVADRFDDSLSFRQFSPWIAATFAISILLCVSVLGVFGSDLTVRLNTPFFSMVRGILFFGSIERVEAVVVALWVFSDFIFFSTLIYMASKNLRILFNVPIAPQKPKLLDMSHGRWLTPLCAAAAFAAGLSMSLDSERFKLFSNWLVPMLNLFFAFLPPLAALIIGRLRRRI